MAASGLKIVLPGDFTDTSLPVLYDDAVLSPGALVLYDLNHSLNPTSGAINATSGTPTNGAVVSNLAWKTASTIIGSGTQSSLSGAVGVTGNFVAGVGSPTGKAERSTKGGLHVVASQAASLASGDSVTLGLASAIK